MHAGTIWAGTDDGQVWITRNSGTDWQNITPPQLTPWSKVSQIDASRFDDDTAFVAVNRFRFDDLRPYVYVTHDGGAHWTLSVAGLPQQPVNAVREDPIARGLLYAATENGVFVSFDDGAHWQSLQQNLPHTSVRDVIVHDNDLVVATHGRGFWILDDVEPLRELAAGVAAPHLFTPELAYRVRRSTNTDTPLPPEEPAGQNPPDGAIVDYTLASPANHVALSFYDTEGHLERRFSSDDTPPAPIPNLDKPTYWERPFVRPADLGGNASLRLGPARNGAALDRAGSADLGRSSRYAAHAGGAARASRHVCWYDFRSTERLSEQRLVVLMDPRVSISREALASAVRALTASGVVDESQLRRRSAAHSKSVKPQYETHQRIGRILARRRGRLRFCADGAGSRSGSDARGTAYRARARPLVTIAKRG